MNKLFLVTFIALCCSVYPQCGSVVKTAGLELDAFPYATGGYYGSAWLGIDHIRVRGVFAKSNPPSFIIPKGYSNLSVKAYALIFDYFPADTYKGWWLASGIEYWDNSIKHSTNTYKGWWVASGIEYLDNSIKHSANTYKFYNTQFTLGGGYVYYFYKNFYLNPWAAIHLKITGNNSITTGNDNYKINFILPEFSIKLGWNF